MRDVLIVLFSHCGGARQLAMGPVSLPHGREVRPAPGGHLHQEMNTRHGTRYHHILFSSSSSSWSLLFMVLPEKERENLSILRRVRTRRRTS